MATAEEVAALMERLKVAEQLAHAKDAELLQMRQQAAVSSSPPITPSLLQGHRLAKFDGKPGSDVKTWLHKVNLSVESSGESRHSMIVANVGQALEGDAAAWFRQVCTAQLCKIGTTTWSEFQEAIMQRFSPIDERQLAINWFMELSRGAAGTSVDSISLFVTTLLSNAGVLAGHMSDLLAIAYLRRALPSNIATQLLLSPNASLEATCGIAIGLTRSLAQEGFLQSPSSAPSSSALPPPPPVFTSTSYTSSSGPVPMDIASLRMPPQLQASRERPAQQQATPGVPRCNFCNVDGHWARDPDSHVPLCPKLIKKLGRTANNN